MRAFAEPLHENIPPAHSRRRDDLIIPRHTPVQNSTPAGSPLLNTLRCVCGSGCSRCNETPESQRSTLAAKTRPEVVVEPKTELKTPEFAASPELIAVMKGKRYVSYGNVGKYVRLIQEALVSSEAPSSDGKRTRLPKHGVDGIFGPETKAAVEEFQREYGVAVDGIVGQQTLYWLDDTFRNYANRPGPADGKKLPDRFAANAPATLAPPKSIAAKMKVEQTVMADPNPKPEISARVSFKAEVEGKSGDKIFYVQNIRRMERKFHLERTEGCKTNCEEARAFIGKAQGLDTQLPYAGPFILTGEKDTAEADDRPAHVAQPGFSPQGSFQKGDEVTLFAHDQFRMFLAHGAGSAFNFSSFNALGFFDWEWSGKVRFTFDGTTWSAGGVKSRMDPKETSFDQSKALIYLGPLYVAEDVETNLSSSRTKIDEKPDDW